MSARVLGLRPLIFLALLAVSCAAPTTVASSPTPTAVAPTSSSSQTTVATPTASARASFSAQQCTTETATAVEVIERYFQLADHGSEAAITDCFAQSYQRSSIGAQSWAAAGPASDVQIIPVDRVNGCERFTVTAKLANGSSINWGGVTSAIVGPDAGRMRFYSRGGPLVAREFEKIACP